MIKSDCEIGFLNEGVVIDGRIDIKEIDKE